MTTVFVYGFRATYSGQSQYDYEAPEVGATHDALLFISQESTNVDFASANNEIAKFGFESVEALRGASLKVESLNSDSYRGFAGFYDEALRNGSSLVYYPNKQK